MKKIEMTEEIMAAKKSTNTSWETLSEKVGISPVFLTSACLGMNSLSEEAAYKVTEILGLSEDVAETLQEFPHKSWDKLVPTDPVIYRFYEIVGVYGETIKEIIHEKFGDGIMSAIDYSMHIDKEENPMGDRVVITMNGKFLPYKSW
ncbi:cyanase [uncultured Cocleimonas sp.]|uniref:cyanase n=1 Tax=uncultured Cocleimonas sp. TaxID=1051587 RepID=UPI002624358C|nr:cyanase [uncultured Cocleimonas sp.]